MGAKYVILFVKSVIPFLRGDISDMMAAKSVISLCVRLKY